jgi:Cu/Ag efflux protein CusF
MKKLTHTFAAFAVVTMMSGGSAAWALQQPGQQPGQQQPGQERPQDQQRPQDPQDRQRPHDPAQTQAQRTADQKTSTVTGELKEVDTDAKKLTITRADGQDWSFRYTDDTEIEGAQQTIAGLATEEGERVKVTFKGEGDNRIATKVEMEDEKKRRQN